LGVRESSVPSSLGLSLQALAERRNKAAHVHVKRAKTLVEPEQERIFIDRIVSDLEIVDDTLDLLVSTFPVAP